jgi:hypothetical protein
MRDGDSKGGCGINFGGAIRELFIVELLFFSFIMQWFVFMAGWDEEFVFIVYADLAVLDCFVEGGGTVVADGLEDCVSLELWLEG